MNNVEQKFAQEIEIERLWVTTEQGQFLFFAALPISLLIVFGLWDTAPHELLIVWFVFNRAANYARWKVADYYRDIKANRLAHVKRYKTLLILGAILSGFSWALMILWFMDPNDPYKVVLIGITIVIDVIGGILFWFYYFPSVFAFILLPTVAIFYLLLDQGNRLYLATVSVIVVGGILGLLTSKKLSDLLNNSLRLSFENAALRKESEEKSLMLESALENMSQGISMTDKDDGLRMWNQHFIRLLGIAGKKVKTNANLSEILNAADPPLQVMGDGQSTYRLPNGQAYAIRQSTFEQGGRLLTYTDVTDLFKREQALEKARKEAVQANAAKTRFLASASHDLRQPIHALGLFFAELSDQVAGPNTAKVIGQIEDSIAAINSMLNALLDISKLDAKVIVPSIEIFELNELFSRLQTEFQPIALKGQNRLKLRPTTALVKTDASMLERMLRNLISNALRYTQNGQVRVVARKRVDRVDILVMDTGVGIPEDQMEEIFLEFHQLQNPARDRRQGLGLGLAIVKRLGQLLNHDINVVSKVGRGSCFSLTLPLVEKNLSLNDTAPQDTLFPSHYSLESRRILVIDDDIAVLEGMQGLLSRWGCRVIVAGSPAEAEGKLNNFSKRIDLLIIDYRLRDNISGIESARQFQQRLGYPISVLIITGDTGPERLREAEASGFPLLHKPVQPAKLRSTLLYLINKLNTQ